MKSFFNKKNKKPIISAENVAPAKAGEYLDTYLQQGHAINIVHIDKHTPMSHFYELSARSPVTLKRDAQDKMYFDRPGHYICGHNVSLSEDQNPYFFDTKTSKHTRIPRALDVPTIRFLVAHKEGHINLIPNLRTQPLQDIILTLESVFPPHAMGVPATFLHHHIAGILKHYSEEEIQQAILVHSNDLQITPHLADELAKLNALKTKLQNWRP